ncbi:MAG TPA: hypothetical protein VMT11_09105 [Myxococcaceae bacterium]|nr:hypothetical protein [Myxococcaceae bacterium]
MSQGEVQASSEPADEFQLIDLPLLKLQSGFVLRSVRRHPRIAATVFLLVLAVAGGVLVILPRTYHVETQLLAQKNSLMPALGNPGRTVPSDADAPTRAAHETVLRRDNLVSLMKQTDLMNRWEATRPRLLKLKDWAIDTFGPARTDEERLQSMIDYMEKQLWVQTTDDTVSMGIDWPDAEQGYRLVDAAQQNFLEQRHQVEVSAIAETISILEGHAQNLKESIDLAMDDLTRAEAAKSARGRGTPVAPVSARRDPAIEAQRGQALEMKVMLDSKRQAIRELEDFRRRRLAELQVELAQQRAVYADAHPAVVKLLQSVAALQKDSPQLASLRQDERQLMTDYDKLAHLPAPATSAANASVRRPVAGSPEETNAELARTRLRFAMAKYDSLLERIDSAKIELDTARAAFKYRYTVIRPPLFPKHPTKPNIPLVVAVGLVFSVLAMFAATALTDVRSRRLIEPWQVERLLELPILGALPPKQPSLLPVQPPLPAAAADAAPAVAAAEPAVPERPATPPQEPEPARAAGRG